MILKIEVSLKVVYQMLLGNNRPTLYARMLDVSYLSEVGITDVE